MPKDNRVRVPATQCPHCKALLTGASCTNWDKKIRPKPGELSVCLKCGGMLVYGKQLQSLALEPATFQALEVEEQQRLTTMQKAARICLLRNAMKKRLN